MIGTEETDNGGRGRGRRRGRGRETYWLERPCLFSKFWDILDQ